MILYFMLLITLALLSGILIGYSLIKKKKPIEEKPNELIPIISTLSSNLDRLNELPDRILRNINGQISAKKGKIGELTTYMQLLAEYDRLIPVGDFIDFIGLKGDSLDFIEVKTGTSRLGKSQVQTKKLIEQHKIRFITVKHKVEVDGQ